MSAATTTEVGTWRTSTLAWSDPLPDVAAALPDGIETHFLEKPWTKAELAQRVAGDWSFSGPLGRARSGGAGLKLRGGHGDYFP